MKRVIFQKVAIYVTLSVIMICLFANTANAQITWDGGAGTTNWGDKNNWSTNTLPTSTDNVSIGPYTVNINIAASVNTLTLSSGASLTLQTSKTLVVSGNWINNSSATAFTSAATSTVTFSGGKAQSISGSSTTTFNNLTISNSGYIVSCNTNINITGNLLVSAGTFDLGAYTANRTTAGGTLTLSGSAVLKIGGINTFPAHYASHSIGTSSTVEYEGSDQTISTLNSSQNYAKLTISGGGNKTLAGNITVAGILTFTSGTITTGAYTLYLTSSVTRTSGHVIGNFKKNITTGTNISKTFEIGDANNYAPVTVTFANILTAGSLTASVTATDHPNLSGSGIRADRAVNRYWTLTNSSILFTTASITPTWVPADVNAGATTVNFKVGKYTGSSWSFPAVTSPLVTSIKASGISSFGDFAVGELCSLTSSAVTTQSCVGGSTGTITASGINGSDPYTFSLDDGAYQSSATFTGLAADTYTINVTDNAGCSNSISNVIVTEYPTSTDVSTTAGTDSWIGHIYDGTNFSNYIGQFTEPETFDESFGGDAVCFPVTANSVPRSIYTETFSVKYRMNSTKKGLYTVDLGSDDGGRLTVDTLLVYNNWTDQIFSSKPAVLIPLTGTSSLLYEFYENGGLNRVVFSNLKLILGNILSTGVTQSICMGNTGSVISGDTYGMLPTGISLSGTGYQWSYSSTPGGPRINIAGATGATFIPTTTTAPFNIAGTYYVYRNAKLSSTNNISPNPYIVTNESNSAIITVTSVPSANITYAGSPYCANSGTVGVTFTGTSGGTFNSTTGLTLNAITGAITSGTSTPGTYTVTYTVAAAGGCSIYSTTAGVTIIGTPTVVSPVTYCQNSTAVPLTATGSNLIWGTNISGSAGGNTDLTSTAIYVASDVSNNRKTFFTSTTNNVNISSIDYTITSWQSTNALQLGIFNSSGTLLATSSTITTVPGVATVTRITNIFNYTLAAAGTYSIGIASGSGNIGGDSPSFPITESTGTIKITGVSPGYRCFNNIKFTATSGTSTAPTPSTTTAGTTNYAVTQTGNGCTTSAATITVIVNAPPVLSQLPTSNIVAYYKFEGNANDVYGNNNGTLQNNPVATTDRFNVSNSAYIMDGSTNYVSTANSYSNPTDFTISIWFKTTTTTGGKLIGFGNSQTGSSGQFDRHIYMNNSGQLYFGIYTGAVYTLNTTASYNDNNWHLATATLSSTSGMAFYVDGQMIGTNAAITSAENHSGYWRIGYDNTNGWTSQPTSFYFNGILDDALIYSRALTASEIATTYLSPDGASNNSPVCAGTNLTLSGNIVPGATYIWTGPNNYTASTASPTFTYTGAAAGTYKLQATLNGCSATAYTKVVSSGNAGQWVGNISTDWADANNWCSATLPTSATNVSIAANTTNMPNVTSVAYCNNLIVNTGATITSTIAGTLNISGTIINNGTFTATNGTIGMVGTAAQIIPANTFSGNQIKNLTINNSAGVTLNGPLNLSGILLATSGLFNTGGYLTLIASSAQTALIDGTGAGTVAGNVTMQGYLASSFGYHYISSPFQAATVAQLSDDINLAATFPSLYKYDESQPTAGWVNYTDTTGLLVPMQGYAANFGSSVLPKVFDIKGVVNNGTIAAPALYNHNKTYTLGFNLVGNPYPSPIDLSIISGWSASNLDNAIYFYDASSTNQYTGTYNSYINGISSNGLANTIVPAMQAFFVHVSNGTYPVTASLTFKNSVRINRLTPSTRALNGVDDRTLIRLNIKSGDDTTTVDPLVVYFDDLATQAFDKELDALKLMNTDAKTPNLYTVSSDANKLSISAIQGKLDTTSKLALGLNTYNNGWFTFNASAIKNLPAGMHVYLSDVKAGITQDLQSNPRYRLYLQTGTYENRFFLTFSKGIINTIPETDTTGTTLQSKNIYSSGKNLYLNVTSSKSTLVLMNLLGQIILKRELGSGYHEIGLQVASGVYLATLISDKDRQIKKIWIQN